jgi:pimeloyl-ACP methyl ester carboxylesterase
MKTLGRILLGLIALFVVITAVFLVTLRRDDVPYETLEATYANAESQYLNLPGDIRVHYRDQGDPTKPVLLMVHGFSASLHTWEPLLEFLGPHYRMISLDLPGHGLTRAPGDLEVSPTYYADLLEQFAVAMELDSFNLMGSSMGGHVAWEYTLAHPERVDALILVAAAGWPREDAAGARRPAILQLIGVPVIGPMLRDLENRPLVEQGLKASFADPAKVDAAMVDRYVNLSRAPGHRQLLISISQRFGELQGATPERLAAITAPVLVMAGKLDNLVPFAHAERFSTAIPRATTAFFDDLGHIPQEEDPRRAAINIAAFLDVVMLANEQAALQAAAEAETAAEVPAPTPAP